MDRSRALCLAVCLALPAAASASDFSFGEAFLRPTYGHPISVAFGDFNGDRRADLIVANGGHAGQQLSGHYLVFGGHPGSNLQSMTPRRYTTQPFTATEGGLSLIDTDGDGRPELAIGWPGRLTLVRRVGTAFVLTEQFAPDQPARLAAADLTGNGHPDLASLARAGTVMTWASDGSGDLVPWNLLHLHTGALDDMVLADVDGDGLPDLVVSRGGPGSEGPVRVLIRYNDGNGGFGEAQALTLDPFPQATRSLAVADFTGNGLADVVVSGSCDPSNPAGLWLFEQASPGQFAMPQGFGVPCEGVLRAVDMDMDGRTDLLLVTAQLVGLYKYDAKRGFYEQDITAAGPAGPGQSPRPSHVAVGDLNGDACPDVAIGNHGHRSVLLITGRGCAPASDLTVEMQLQGSGSARQLAIHLRNLAGVPNGTAAVDVAVRGRDPVPTPHGCVRRPPQQRELVEFHCTVGAPLHAGQQRTFALQLGAQRQDLHVEARVSSKLPDPDTGNNTLARAVPRP